MGQEDESDYEFSGAAGEQVSMMHENTRCSPVEKEVMNNFARNLERMRRENEIMQWTQNYGGREFMGSEDVFEKTA